MHTRNSGGAIVIIVLRHMDYIFPGCLPHLGSRGVEFFFLISGLLIGMKYYDTNKMHNLEQSVRYTIKKGKRIYLLHIITMILMLFSFLKYWIENEIEIKKILIIIGANLIYLQSWIPSSDVYYGLNSVAWFLSAILFCYITTFVFFGIIKRIGVGPLVISLFVIEIVWEFLVMKFLPDQYTFCTYILPLSRSLDFGIGICLGAWSIDKQKVNLDWMLIILLGIYVAMIIKFDTVLFDSVYHVVETLLVWIIVIGSGKFSKNLFENSLLVKIGDISELIFLTHKPVISYMDSVWRKFLGNYNFIEWIIILICIFIVAIVLDHCHASHHLKNK